MAAGNSAFDQLLSTTLKNYVPKLTDNVFSARPLFYALTNGQLFGVSVAVRKSLFQLSMGKTQQQLLTQELTALTQQLRTV